MKKSIALLLALLCLALAACGGDPPLSDEEQAEVEARVAQYNEWAEQAAEIESDLTLTLRKDYDNDIVDIEVSQPMGEISALVSGRSSKISRSDFGAIVSLLGNRFVELAAKYGDYSFDEITFFYYYTMRNGDIYKDPSIIYYVGIDGAGRYLTSSELGSESFTATPDEVYYYLSGVSPDSRSIPEPSKLQEIIVPDNLFDPAPKEIFSSVKDEDKYYNHAYYISGVVTERAEVRGDEAIRFSTEYGDIYVVSIMIPLPEVSVDDEITMFFTYWKWDKVVKGAFVEYVYHE